MIADRFDTRGAIYNPGRPFTLPAMTSARRSSKGQLNFHHSRCARVIVMAGLLTLVCATTEASDEKSIRGFTSELVKLSPTVDHAEAEAGSVTSHRAARQLARDYRVVGPAVFQNILIHMGVRDRGYCFHYAFDIGAKLKALRLKTLTLHWAASEVNGPGEHNVVVVTALNQAFTSGYIIDGWRNTGRLVWWPVTKDSAYVWHENPALTQTLQNRTLTKAASDERPAPHRAGLVGTGEDGGS